jgi:hypothetical protein
MDIFDAGPWKILGGVMSKKNSCLLNFPAQGSLP